MAQGEPSPRQTLALLLGASSFRRAPNLAQGRAFYNSALDFYEYLTGVNGLGLPRENVASLFDDTRSPSDQLQDIREFLESRSTALKSEGLNAQDLMVYYVGHGLFSGADYCLAVRSTDERSEGMTSIRVSDLASIIKNSARFLRKFFILDCCFSAAAYREFQSSPLNASRVKLLQELPQRGTALLCSASAQDPSLAPVGRSHTMFSGALLSALHHGHGSLGPRLSLSELGDLVKAYIHETYPDTAVRPEVHSPDQREGDVADVPLFPNTSFVTQKAEEEQRKGEAAAAERKHIAQEKAEGERRKREQAETAERERQIRARREAERQARERAAAEQERTARRKEAEQQVRPKAASTSRGHSEEQRVKRYVVIGVCAVVAFVVLIAIVYWRPSPQPPRSEIPAPQTTGENSSTTIPASPSPVPTPVKIILRGVHFDFNGAEIRPVDAPVLDEAAETLKANPTVKAYVNGYSDALERGDNTSQYAFRLSQNRANSVIAYLVDKGVPRDQLVAQGLGATHFVATNETPLGRAENRRVELVPTY